MMELYFVNMLLYGMVYEYFYYHNLYMVSSLGEMSYDCLHSFFFECYYINFIQINRLIDNNFLLLLINSFFVFFK